MIKVRIGNDIKLSVILNGVSDFDQANIKLIKSYLINTDNEPREESKIAKAFHALEDPDSKVVDIDGKWYQIGELDPYTLGDFNIFWPYHDPDMYHFDICGPHGYHFGPWNWGYEHPRERWFLFDSRLRHRVPFPCRHWHGDRDFSIFTKGRSYMAPCRVTNKKNQIEVYFPGNDQWKCGTYKLVIVLTTYEPGWGVNNLRERTIDYDDIFTIVNDKDPEGATGDVKISLGSASGDLASAKICYAGIISVRPPKIDSDNANITDLSFESDNTSKDYGLDAAEKYTSLFKQQSIVSNKLQFDLSCNGDNDGNSYYLWVKSGLPVSSISIGASSISTPITDMGKHGNYYYYAVPNPLAYTDSLRVYVNYNLSNISDDAEK